MFRLTAPEKAEVVANCDRFPSGTPWHPALSLSKDLW